MENVRLHKGAAERGRGEREGRGFRVLAEATVRREVSARARRHTAVMAADRLLLHRRKTAEFRGAQESAE